MLRSAVV
jgi:intraflagellar transport protein 80